MIVLFVCFFKKLACKAYKIYNFFPTNECFSNEYSCTLAEVSYHLRESLKACQLGPTVPVALPNY